MSGSWKDKYRVDTVPRWLYPWFMVGSSVAAVPYYLYFFVIHFTCRFEIEENSRGLIKTRNFIHATWHDSIFLYFAFFRKFENHVWINHPMWHMKPIHIAMKWCGIGKLILGSTGHDGREAADKLVNVLKQGCSTALTPDGPAGPPRVLKKGILHIAGQSGVPILPFRFRATKYFRLPDWDRKYIPLPFATIYVAIADPLPVTNDTMEASFSRLTERLGQ